MVRVGWRSGKTGGGCGVYASTALLGDDSDEAGRTAGVGWRPSSVDGSYRRRRSEYGGGRGERKEEGMNEKRRKGRMVIVSERALGKKEGRKGSPCSWVRDASERLWRPSYAEGERRVGASRRRGREAGDRSRKRRR